MRYLGLAFAVIAYTLTPSEPTQAENLRNFNSGAWKVGSYTNDITKKFSGCIASVYYNSGVRQTLLMAVGRLVFLRRSGI
jgi:hypothetical protein